MTKEDVEQWCEKNNHIIVDISKKKIPADVVLRIAEASTDISDITRKTRRPQYSIARMIAASYLYKKMPSNKMADMLGVTPDMIIYYRGQNILEVELKYLKEWQRESVTFFKNKIEEVETSL